MSALGSNPSLHSPEGDHFKHWVAAWLECPVAFKTFITVLNKTLILLDVPSLAQQHNTRPPQNGT